MLFRHFGSFSALFVAVLALPSPAVAAEWYVAPAGSNGAEGTLAAPLATLARAREVAGDGDRILLRRGGTYRAVELDMGSGVTVEAYGEGDMPVLTASVAVELDGTWQENAAVLTGEVSERVVACYVNGRFVRLARYPNAGYLSIDNDDDPDTIQDVELAERPGVEPGRWVDAQVRWRRWSWWWETRPITSHAAVDTLGLGEDGRFQDAFSDPGSGYFIDNDLDELDAPGEWFWADGTLYLYPPESVDPESMTVEVVTAAQEGYLDPNDLPAGVISTGTSFRDVAFQRYAGPALELDGPATVERCTFAEIESTAVRYAWDAQPFTIRESVFRDVRNVAVQGWADAAGATGSLIERNLFLRIGVERGYGGSGSWHAAGIILGQANAATVRLNRFVDTGYSGIILGSDGQTVEQNVFVRTMQTLNDGAAVYTNCNSSIIRENIILDTIGDLLTSHPWYPLGHGVWLEFLSDFRDSEITDNTIYGSNGNGIFLPNNFSCTVSGNKVVDSRVAGLDLSADSDPVQGHEIRGNTLAAVAPSRRLELEENLSQWLLPPYEEAVPVALQYAAEGDYGTMSESTLIAAESGAGVIRADDTEWSTLDQWTAAASWASAEGSRVVIANAILLFNDTEAAVEMVTPPGTWSLADGSPVSERIALEPFRSAVLVTSEPVASTPPYNSASGIDWRAEEPTVVPFGSDFVGGTGGASTGDGGTGAAGTTSEAGARGLMETSNEAGAGSGNVGGGGAEAAGAAESEAGAGGGATAPSGSDARAGQAGREEAQTSSEGGDGCGCSVPAAPRRGAFWWSLAGLGLLVWRRSFRIQH